MSTTTTKIYTGRIRKKNDAQQERIEEMKRLEEFGKELELANKSLSTMTNKIKNEQISMLKRMFNRLSNEN